MASIDLIAVMLFLTPANTNRDPVAVLTIDCDCTWNWEANPIASIWSTRSLYTLSEIDF